jgi:hypothetical protein
VKDYFIYFDINGIYLTPLYLKKLNRNPIMPEENRAEEAHNLNKLLENTFNNVFQENAQ